MRIAPVVASVGLVLAGLFVLAARTEVALIEPARTARDASAPAAVVFVCRNGVAMSVWSAAYFNRLAAERGIPERAAARASLPSLSAVPFRMRFALALDGFRLERYRPRVIDEADAGAAALVVAIDTELPPDARPDRARVEVWDGFPPMREEYFPSRAALRARVAALVVRLAAQDAARRTVSRSRQEPFEE